MDLVGGLQDAQSSRGPNAWRRLQRECADPTAPRADSTCRGLIAQHIVRMRNLASAFFNAKGLGQWALAAGTSGIEWRRWEPPTL